uniref:Uncharacterized protein n=1 Tax=Ditylenchus dipsaci TaxID=166011 RepID=A0A915E6W7_9BILA
MMKILLLAAITFIATILINPHGKSHVQGAVITAHPMHQPSIITQKRKFTHDHPEDVHHFQGKTRRITLSSSKPNDEEDRSLQLVSTENTANHAQHSDLDKVKEKSLQMVVAAGKQYQTNFAETVSKVVAVCIHKLSEVAAKNATDFITKHGLLNKKDADNLTRLISQHSNVVSLLLAGKAREAVLSFGIKQVLNLLTLDKTKEVMKEQAFDLVQAAVPEAQKILVVHIQKLGEQFFSKMSNIGGFGIDLFGHKSEDFLTALGLPGLGKHTRKLILDNAPMILGQTDKIMRRVPSYAIKNFSKMFKGAKIMAMYFKESVLNDRREIFTRPPAVLCLAIHFEHDPIENYGSGYGSHADYYL